MRQLRQAPEGADQRVCAIVVTRNRQELLRACLEAIGRQTRPVDQLVVVDNASEDDTAEMVQLDFSHATLLRLVENRGGAGGFRHGMAWAHDRGFGWLWLLDDDTLAEPQALEALLAGAGRAPRGQPLLMASTVLWKDGRLHPMNVGLPRWRARAPLAEGVAHGLLLMRYATFVSVLVRREAVDRFGLPLEHYFIRTDDVEFTARVLKEEPGFLVPESRVRHWTAEPHGPDSGDDERLYYLVRNSLLLLRGTALSRLERFDYGRWLVRALWPHLRAEARSKRNLTILARGLRDGMTGATR